MVELFDNSSQFLVTLSAASYAGFLFHKNNNQTYFLLICFFATFSLGVLHWTLHVLLFNQTPQVFYVSELAWLASFIFLLTLVDSLVSDGEKDFWHPALLLVPIICIPQLLLYLTHGDILYNLLLCTLTMAAAYFSLRGFLYARRQTGKARQMQYFHLAVLSICTLEFSLWTASCFWTDNSLSNPYFWIDFMLTASLFFLLPATKKAVDL